jgi:hypothetical protein
MLSIMIKKTNKVLWLNKSSKKIIGFTLIWDQQDTEFENVRSLLSIFFKHVF